MSYKISNPFFLTAFNSLFEAFAVGVEYASFFKNIVVVIKMSATPTVTPWFLVLYSSS